ncbi:UNVERIFIED_CONTAM: hypothetical protein Sradi_3835700 [Sesamum radiatum]|uniref:Myb/SANT-like domain-containing protein n=1 Tax=Sesamum radiatum TaxID=300843 RepID=A0AAW2Q1B5_SESRA
MEKEKFETRRTWSVKEEEAFVNGLKSLVVSGWKCDNGFRNGLVSMMSKSRFGWDDEKNMITVEENSIWDDYVKVDPSAKTLRYKSFPFFPAWREIFDKDHAFGDGAKDGKAIADVVRTKETKETQDYYVTTADWNPKESFVNNDGDPVQSSQMNVDSTTNLSTDPKPTSGSAKKRKKIDLGPEKRLVDMVSTFCQDANARLGTLTKVLQTKFGDSDKCSGLAEALVEIEGLDEND